MPRFLGDSVTATSAIRMLRELYPQEQIFLLARPPVAGLFADEVIAGCQIIVDKRFSSQRQSLFKVAFSLRPYRFAQVYHFRNSFADALLCKLAGVRHQVGYAKNGRTPLLTHAVMLDPNYHYQYRYCHLVNVAHGQPFSQMPTVQLLAGKTPLPSPQLPKVAVYFGGQYKLDRHYPYELACQALRQLAGLHQCHFVLLGDQQEVADNVRLADYLRAEQIEVSDLTSTTTVVELVRTINSCDLLLTIDSGQLHMAAALQTPYVAVVGFGTSPWSCVEPKVSHGIHLTVNSLTLDLATQISEISPQRIAKAADQLLQHRG
ncbi:glycosyltransferase family 9 protein [Rheinheimera sp. F8]|uniref:glycosyltransferase family 9 protein n=1 Tax=Rheinheimera sp. F8 TaxID=1763998 RepID=UPI001AD847F7|nr:glycosyltransferase family 9 protein [Rheinheimera sp. F8]